MDHDAARHLRDLQHTLQQASETIDVLVTLDQTPPRAALITSIALTQYIEQAAQRTADALTAIARNQTPPVPLSDIASARKLSINGLRARLTRISESTTPEEPWGTEE